MQDSATTELTTLKFEMSSSNQHLISELEDSHQQLSTAKAESARNADAAESAREQAESWESQLITLQESSAAEMASLRQQLNAADNKSAQEEERFQAAQREVDDWRSRFQALQESSTSSAAAAAQASDCLCKQVIHSS